MEKCTQSSNTNILVQRHADMTKEQRQSYIAHGEATVALETLPFSKKDNVMDVVKTFLDFWE
eukprot:4884494-Ditylum_brightwellii.AAC.1